MEPEMVAIVVDLVGGVGDVRDEVDRLLEAGVAPHAVREALEHAIAVCASSAKDCRGKDRELGHNYRNHAAELADVLDEMTA